MYKRSPNICDLLVRADVSPSVARPSHFLSIPSGNYSCGRCAQCNFTTKTNVFSHPHSGREFKIKGVITCTTKNVIYMIKCPCGLAYIGKTQRALKTRIAEHRRSICTNDKKNRKQYILIQKGITIPHLGILELNMLKYLGEVVMSTIFY